MKTIFVPIAFVLLCLTKAAFAIIPAQMTYSGGQAVCGGVKFFVRLENGINYAPSKSKFYVLARVSPDSYVEKILFVSSMGDHLDAACIKSSDQKDLLLFQISCASSACVKGKYGVVDPGTLTLLISPGTDDSTNEQDVSNLIGKAPPDLPTFAEQFCCKKLTEELGQEADRIKRWVAERLANSGVPPMRSLTVEQFLANLNHFVEQGLIYKEDNYSEDALKGYLSIIQSDNIPGLKTYTFTDSQSKQSYIASTNYYANPSTFGNMGSIGIRAIAAPILKSDQVLDFMPFFSRESCDLHRYAERNTTFAWKTCTKNSGQQKVVLSYQITDDGHVSAITVRFSTIRKGKNSFGVSDSELALIAFVGASGGPGYDLGFVTTVDGISSDDGIYLVAGGPHKLVLQNPNSIRKEFTLVAVAGKRYDVFTNGTAAARDRIAGLDGWILGRLQDYPFIKLNLDSNGVLVPLSESAPSN